MLEHAHDLLN